MKRNKSNRRRRQRARKAVRRPRPKLSINALLVPPALAVLVAGALFGATALLDHPLRQVVVEGTFQRVTPVQIEGAFAAELERGFLSIDLAELRARAATLDWVDHVEIGRVWPDTLKVRIIEHQAAARWGERGLLNVRGELFTTDAQHAYPELPRLAGPDGSEHDVASLYLAVRGRLAAAGLAPASLVLDERGAWRILLRSGQEIRLGRRDVTRRLDRFFEVVAPALAARLERVAYVDLRYVNGFAVGWSDAQANQPEATLARAKEASGSG